MDSTDTPVAVEPVVDVHHCDGTARLAVSGDVDLECGVRLLSVTQEALRAEPREVVIDLTDVPFMDSAGLNHLVRALREVRPVPLRLVVSHPPVVSLFEMTGLSDAFAVQRVA